MKKILSLILAIVMALSLCACGKSEAVKAVEGLIEAIGPVSISSAESIKKAEEAYAALSAEEQKQVKNYDDLEEAKKNYNDLGIVLTVENYDKYLNVSIDPQLFDAIDYGRAMGLDRNIGSYVYSGIENNVFVSGKTANYDYNDVVVTVKCSGFYLPLIADIVKQINKGQITYDEYALDNMVPINESLTVTTDIIGDGFNSSAITIPDGYWVVDSTIDTIEFEVVDVSGILTK